ncbi:paralemmin-3 isoform X2 [Pleuronectes platessa]|uniref:paralemmin-3 isoform X2 n=1 Tax=Pleuronectes platessa TaxID=8262 RepID=UPI00232A62F7|nr:paralemmin-3 isoform X2 [Pleuronectes platessa]
MDETEKYQQRLEAIAEKRRQQEEQDKTRRELEDEKIRLQQLKRKSLRDQWLMEGPPLSPASPASPEPQSPRSPLWGSPSHESENHINTLQSKSLRLDEEIEEQMEDASQAEAVTVDEAAAEMVRGVVVKNGDNNATAFETSEDEVNESPRLDGAAVVLTNGGGHFSLDTNQNSNGPVAAAEGVVSMKSEPALSLCVSGSEPVHVPDININEEDEDEEGILVIRAECVIITDEGEDAPEDVRPQEDEQETPLPDQEGESVEEVTAPETFTQPDKGQTSDPTAEAQPDTGDRDVDGDIKTNENINGSESEDPTSVQLQSPTTYVEGATVALVPVYSETHPSTVTSRVEVEVAALSPEGAQDPTTACGQFQEVPLADPQVNQRTEAGQGKQEQEPLLSQVAAPHTQVDPAAVANSPANSETHSPTRASQGEETVAPKRKTCQCCSVM